MASVVSVCNMALSHCRAGSINDISEPSLQAQTCKLWYETSRDQILGETTWQFSRKIAPLASVSDVIFTYAYAYSYPNDCLKIERLIGSYEQIEQGSTSSVFSRCLDPNLVPGQTRQIAYDIFNINNHKIIGANEPDLRIDYIAKITDPNLFSSAFTIALSHLLASNIAVPITGVDIGRKIRSDSLQLYRTYLASAIASDANEKYHEPVESEFVTCRR